MSAFKLERRTAEQRTVVVQNGRTAQDVHIFIPGDASEPFLTDVGNIVNAKVRTTLAERVPETARPAVLRALADLAVEVSAAKARRSEEKSSAPAAIDREHAYRKAGSLLRLPDIPKRAAQELARRGVAGESRLLQVLYLAITSRLLGKPLRPISAIIKALSSAGKSFAVECVLQLFPPSAYYFMTSMSERALVYDPEPLAHRMLVIAEATGMEGEMQALIIRSLLSEGRLVYPYVDKDEEGRLVTRHAIREGPTGLILTTTRNAIHPENETRLLSLSVTESPEQTRAVFRATAQRLRTVTEPDYAHWHALQDWLSVADNRVAIPYAEDLAELTDNSAVRMRRDFTTLLAFIATRAILHQETRDRDATGQIVATMEDYEATRALIGELISYGIQTQTPAKLKATVGAVRDRLASNAMHATTEDVAAALKLEKSAVHKWVRKACAEGYLVNTETRKRQPARLVLGEPLPDDRPALPDPDALLERSAIRSASDDRSAHDCGTPSDSNTTASLAVPPFRGKPEGFADVLFDPSADDARHPAETAWNGGTIAQPYVGNRVSVPRSDVEPHAVPERSTEPDEPPLDESQAAVWEVEP